MTGDIVPRTRGWRATIPEAAAPPNLLVTGEIELGNTNERPRLEPSEPQDADRMVLTLDIEIVTDGPSGLAMHWAPVEFRHPVAVRTPSTVRLLWMGVEVALLPIAA